MPTLSVERKAARRGALSRAPSRSCEVLDPGTLAKPLVWEPGDLLPGPPRKGPGPHWEGRRAEAGDARAGEVRPFRSSEETGEQRRATASGVGGAKGRGQGERGRARHAPDTETGKRVTRAGPRTASSKPTLRRQTPKAGAVCGKSARTVLCGGRPVTGVPTAIAAVFSLRLFGLFGAGISFRVKRFRSI